MEAGNYLKEYTMVKRLVLSMIIFVGFGNQLTAMRRVASIAFRGLVAYRNVTCGGGVTHIPCRYVATVPIDEASKVVLPRQRSAGIDDSRCLSVALNKIYTWHVNFLTDPNVKDRNDATVQSITDDFIEALTVILDDPALVLDEDTVIAFYDRLSAEVRDLVDSCYIEERNNGLSCFVWEEACKSLDRLKYLHDKRYSVFGDWQAEHAVCMVSVIKIHFIDKALDLLKEHQKTEHLVFLHEQGL